jgi:hypothetical protein
MRKSPYYIEGWFNRACQWLFLVVLLFLISGCTSSTSEEEKEKPIPVVPPIDLSGVWGGTWSGFDPTAGDISGNWEADLTQRDTAVTGSG